MLLSNVLFCSKGGTTEAIFIEEILSMIILYFPLGGEPGDKFSLL